MDQEGQEDQEEVLGDQVEEVLGDQPVEEVLEDQEEEENDAHAAEEPQDAEVPVAPGAGVEEDCACCFLLNLLLAFSLFLNSSTDASTLSIHVLYIVGEERT